METAIAELKQQGTNIEQALARLEEEAMSLEGLIEGYAKPLSVIALEPKNLVIFYPVILAAVVTVFAARQLLLRRRAAALASAYRELGVSSRILDVCFTELPSTAKSDSELSDVPAGAGSARRLVGWLWVVPVGFAVTSFAWVLASKSLSSEAPRFLYLSCTLVLLAVCVCLLRPPRDRIRVA